VQVLCYGVVVAMAASQPRIIHQRLIMQSTFMAQDWGPDLHRAARLTGTVLALFITLAILSAECAYELGRLLRKAIDARNDQLSALWVGLLGVTPTVPAPAPAPAPVAVAAPVAPPPAPAKPPRKVAAVRDIAEAGIAAVRAVIT
jgi:hypothetical protein